MEQTTALPLRHELFAEQVTRRYLRSRPVKEIRL
jgi:hypothetical protein